MMPKSVRTSDQHATARPQVVAKPIRLPSPAVQQLIREAAHDLAMDEAFAGEISAVIARRFGIEERVIDRVIARFDYSEYRARCAARIGHLNAEQIAEDVRRRTLAGD